MPPQRQPLAPPGRILRTIPRAAWRTMPWKNGGGVTHELWREGGDPFDLRLSIAEVAADGPFSLFPGVDRVITLLVGAGFRLQAADGRQVTVAQPAVPFAFAGEEPWHCTLLGGPVLDFNAMVRRAYGRVTVTAMPPGVAEGGLLLPLDDGEVAGRPVARHELLIVEGAVSTGVALLRVATTPHPQP